MVPPCSDRISRVPPYSDGLPLLRLRGCHPLRPGFPTGSSLWKTRPGPRSLATTSGVSIDVLSSGYLDVSVPRVRPFDPMDSGQKYLVQASVLGLRPPRRPRISPAPPADRKPTTDSCQVGFPIRKSRDQRVLSPPPGLSQSATSFIASCRQGIHQTPFSRLIRSGGGATPLAPRAPLPGSGSHRAVSLASANGPKAEDADPGQCFDLERLLPDVPPPPRAMRGPARTRSPPHSEGIPKASRVSLSSRCQSRRPRAGGREPEAKTPPKGPNESRMRTILDRGRGMRPPPDRDRRAMVGRGGLEPPTSRLSGVRSNQLSYRPLAGAGPRTEPRLRRGGGGACRDRTGDLMLAKHALSQLS